MIGFHTPIITPATKAEEGHDEDISREDIIKHRVSFSEADYIHFRGLYSHALLQRGTDYCKESRVLILVDTKYEFGKTARRSNCS